jgi:hypothetical protein
VRRGLAWRLASVVLAAYGAGAGCSRGSSPPPDPRVHSVALPEMAAPELPDAPGRAAFVGACSTCHSQRYLLDQPPLPRKTWAAEVDKMRHTYGAPVPDDLAPVIVDYLVAVRGAP